MLIPASKELALAVISQRKKLKLSQAAVGNRVGLKQKTISAFENKPAGTKLDTLFQILSALNLDLVLIAKDAGALTDKEWQQEW